MTASKKITNNLLKYNGSVILLNNNTPQAYVFDLVKIMLKSRGFSFLGLCYFLGAGK